MRPGTLLLSLALALPAIPMAGLASGEEWRVAIRPSGDVAAKLLVVALALRPLAELLPGAGWLGWLIARRRMIGLAAFAYAVLHLVVFSASIGRLDWILQGMAFASMWTGWLAFLLLLVVASVSNDPARRFLGAAWKGVQRLAWPAAALALSHWLLLSPPLEALAHFAPLALLWLAARLRTIWFPGKAG